MIWFLASVHFVWSIFLWTLFSRVISDDDLNNWLSQSVCVCIKEKLNDPAVSCHEKPCYLVNCLRGRAELMEPGIFSLCFVTNCQRLQASCWWSVIIVTLCGSFHIITDTIVIRVSIISEETEINIQLSSEITTNTRTTQIVLTDITSCYLTSLQHYNQTR